jgi:GMP synthase-like glutamine amidotransferase
MNIYEEDKYSWLKIEKKFIEQAIRKVKPVLGICLGSQLIADVLGTKVYPNRYKEIGWFPIQLTDVSQSSPIFGAVPREMTVFHWHGDTFDLPHGATHIASSMGCSNQAFTYGKNVVALQFHLEATSVSVQEMVHHGADEIVPATYIQPAPAMLSGAGNAEESNRAMFHILDKLTSLSL